VPAGARRSAELARLLEQPRTQGQRQGIARELKQVAILEREIANWSRPEPVFNGASFIALGPFIGVELTSWKARTLPQVAAVSVKASATPPVGVRGSPSSAASQKPSQCQTSR
jgi:hypothetical protein